ncbi:PAS domain S-box protein [Phenylobacterium sp.]|uniref:PAS domain-containing hybrid sensor histidine kinase/response regulator n=1 Tax=Phenylobacterium sp. TaxID=1871053 RepID=UPI0025F7428A|nr:PAS domain S-box protein [Phenylobacterium sp.]MBX3484934.1 PAS domain S-box protein [Phenylobacterium sp.]
MAAGVSFRDTLIARGGEAGRLIAARDWSRTSIGPIEAWPQSLKTALGLILLSPVPIVMLWGEDGVMLYNDAYSIFAGGRHPDLLGSKVREGWPEVADFNDNVMKVGLAGGTLAYRDQELTLYRHGRAEQVWMNLDYSPVLDESGRPAGVVAVVVETTERVHADQRAATERERFLQAFEQAPGFIVAMRGPEHRVEFVNAAHRAVFGSAGWPGRTIREAFPDIAGQGFFEMLDEVYATGRRHVADAEAVAFRRPDGVFETRYLTFVYEPMRDADGTVVGVLCEGADVTGAQEAQAALRQSEARFRTALEITTVGAIGFTLDGALTEANDAFLAMSGYTRADLEAGRLSLQSLTAPEWQPTVHETLEVLRAQGETSPYEKEYVRADGSRWWGLFAAKRLQDGTGFKFVIDVTERKAAEVALHEQTAALEALNRAAATTALERDLARVVQTVTDTGVEISGAEFGAFFYNVADPDGESYRLYTLSGATRDAFEGLPMPRNTAVFAPTFSGEGIVRSDDIRRDPRYGRNAPRKGMPEGHLPVASYLAVPVASRGGAVLGGLFFAHSEPGRFTEAHELRMVGLAAQAAIAIDNARLFQEVQAANETLEQRVAQRTRELTEAHEALRQAQKMEAVGQLTGGIAHDFNNLLMGISGSLELIERALAQPAKFKNIERYLQGAQASARRAASLTQRLLAFSRRQTLDPRPTDVNKLICGMEDLFRRTVGPAIEVEVVGQASLWPALIDSSQLESALLNLTINARDAMPEGGRITIETANKWLDDRGARERDLAPGQYLSICVTDTGTGIAKEVIDRIFDPFFTTKPTGEGTGLGLSMVHGYVRQSGGQVRVYSEVGQGTTMCLYLPRYAGAVEDEDIQQIVAPELGSGEAVLIIDDEATVRMLMADVLAEAGYTVLQAQDGPSGMRILESEQRIDLLITDVGLPGGMNGRQVADAARLTRPDLSVLFVTGFAENAAIGNGHLPPGMEVVTKPFGVGRLAAKVSEIIERRALAGRAAT